MRSPEPCGCNYRPIGPSMAGSCGGGQVLMFMTILEAYINGRCDLVDPCKRVTDASRLEREYDFIVVGGGTAGSVVASRLSENPRWKVLLVEAGGDEPPASSVPSLVTAYWNNPETDWMYRTEPQEKACKLEPDSRCSWPRGKVLGGSSVLNGMMYMRGHPEDYDRWEQSGIKGWAWKDVKRWFLVAEDNKEIGSLVRAEHHARGGPLTVQRFRHAPEFAKAVLEAGAEIGYPESLDLNGDAITGFAIAQTLNRGGSRLSTARAYLRPVSRRQNLDVVLNTAVQRLVFKSGTTEVAGVELQHRGIKKTVKASKEVILAAGALNSPQLLLLSGVGPASALEPHGIEQVLELPGVGQNLHNHVGVSLRFEITKENATNLLDWTAVTDYMLNREGPMSSTGMSQVTGKVNSCFAKPDGSHPDVQYFFDGYYVSCADSGAIGAPEDPSNKGGHRELGISCIYLHPESRGRIELASKNPFQAPKMFPNYFQVDRDIDAVADAARTAFKLVNTTIMQEKYGVKLASYYGKKCNLKPDLNPSEDQIKCLIKHHTAPENHQVGTCKMGAAEDKMAVLDENLAVRGLTGVRVMDASSIPTIVSGNTMAPVIMIAERGSYLIREKWARPSTEDANGVDVGNRFSEFDQGTFNKPPNWSGSSGFRQGQPNNPWGNHGQASNNQGVYKPMGFNSNDNDGYVNKPNHYHHHHDHNPAWHQAHNVPLPTAQVPFTPMPKA